MSDALAQLLGLPPDAPHLTEALTHPSFRNEKGAGTDNQRLEFFGDAILGFCVSELLFERFPGADEGTLTRMRAQLVNAESLAGWAREAELAECLRLGRGAAASGLGNSTNVLADAVEALIAAVCLDGGLDAARRLCAQVVEHALVGLDSGVGADPKSDLQERVQALGGAPPRYRLVDSGGPAHDRWFVVEVIISEVPVASARGRSKRTAERDAAQRAIVSGDWEGMLLPHPETET